MAFGAIPADIVDCIRSNNDDYIIKLRCSDDLDYVFDSLQQLQNSNDLRQLRHYASSFIQFISEYLLSNDDQDIKITFTAIKGIKLVINKQYK